MSQRWEVPKHLSGKVILECYVSLGDGRVCLDRKGLRPYVFSTCVGYVMLETTLAVV